MQNMARQQRCRQSQISSNEQSRSSTTQYTIKINNAIYNMPWFDIYDHDVKDEAEGTDFLEMEAARNLTTHSARSKINNVLCHFGADKPKTNSPEWIVMKLHEFTITLEFAGELTGNAMCNVALPVDANTIRNYDLKSKDFYLPGYQVNDNSTLLPAFLDVIEDAYLTYVTNEKKTYESNGEGEFMARTDFAGQIKPVLGEIVKFCVKFWFLHPWFDRKEAYESATDYLKKNFKKKNDCQRLIGNILADRKGDILLQSVLGLDTVELEGKKVFAENESAQHMITKFLQHHGRKVPKDTPDVLEKLKEFVADLEHEDDKAKFAKFQDMVPRETEVYKDKKRRYTQKIENEQRKKMEKETAASIALEKKQKLLNDLNKNEATTVVDPAIAAAEEELEDERMDDAEIVTTDVHAEFKMPYLSFDIVEQERFEASGRRADKKQAGALNKPIGKTILALAGKKVTIKYTKPGSFWKMSINARVQNVVAAMNVFSLEQPEIIDSCNTANNNKITKKNGRVILSLMMHVSIVNEKDLQGIGLPASFYEPNFLRDLANTKQLWLPPLMAGNLITLQALYELICLDEEINGYNSKDRADMLITEVSKKTAMPAEKGNQVVQIIQLIRKINDELESDNVGAAPLPIDPFDTKSDISHQAEMHDAAQKATKEATKTAAKEALNNAATGGQ